MTPDTFWISQDGQIISQKQGHDRHLELTIAFQLKDKQETSFARAHLKDLQFSERSTLARIGIEVIAAKPPSLNRNRLLLQAKAFPYDTNFPVSTNLKDVLYPGTSIGRLFYAPEQNKLSSDEVWEALKENRIKLPDTISIDRSGRVHLTPHRVNYTLPSHLTTEELERVIHDAQSRTFLDKLQIREDITMLSIPPKSGILTSCSMYLKDHYVVLNRGEGNLGLHSGAVLLDPIKTFGSNIMLEIYNTSDQVVVNPMVSVDVYRASPFSEKEFQAIRNERILLQDDLENTYKNLDSNPKINRPLPKTKTGISVRGQSARTTNESVVLKASPSLHEDLRRISNGEAPSGYLTISQALSHVEKGADTLILDYFPNLFEHIEILARIHRLNLKKIIFRKASRISSFFLSSDTHDRLETYSQLGIDVYWLNETLKDLYLHTYKKGLGFFILPENITRFQKSTILAFYGSANAMGSGETKSIQELVLKMTDFFGPNVGVLTGGGGGVMGLATEIAREKQCLTGASFLELETQPPNVAVDFFNSFEENSRHNRQKWFQVADFCIFNMGGVGTLEEAGIELCNLKLGIRPRIPYVFFHDTFWNELKSQFKGMIRTNRVPAWMEDYVLFSGDPDEIIEFYRKKLQII